MLITVNSTVKEILAVRPESKATFEKHGVDVNLECDENILDTELELCESMCHIDDIDALIKDLRQLFES